MPEGLRRDDLWIFDLRRADFSYGIPSQHASIAGASWKEVRCAQTPKARDASPFCVLGSQACFIYGGRTGFDGVDAQVLDDLWCFTGTWQPGKYKGTTPGPRANHSLIPISDHEIALVGGEGPDGIEQVVVFVLLHRGAGSGAGVETLRLGVGTVGRDLGADFEEELRAGLARLVRERDVEVHGGGTGGNRVGTRVVGGAAVVRGAVTAGGRDVLGAIPHAGARVLSAGARGDSDSLEHLVRERAESALHARRGHSVVGRARDTVRAGRH